jgi:hypothetical protein
LVESVEGMMMHGLANPNSPEESLNRVLIVNRGSTIYDPARYSKQLSPV